MTCHMGCIIDAWGPHFSQCAFLSSVKAKGGSAHLYCSFYYTFEV